jgi:hypothetical protein
MTQLSSATTRRSAGRLRDALIGALLAGVLLASAVPALPVAAQDAPAGSGGGQFTPREDDFDIDGLLNADEATYGTDPNNWDTDGDGVGDGAEVNYGTDPLVPAPPTNDPDVDGLSNDDERAYGTDPNNWDTDGDGVGDGAEIDIASDPLTPEEHVYVPLADSDEDGIPDAEEPVWGTHPREYDSDGDRIGDGWEAYHYGTDPTSEDTDQEGLSDSEELFTYGTDPLDEDTDGDGYPDGQEVHGACPGDPLDPAKGPRFMC